MELRFQEVVKHYRQQQGLSVRAFGRALTEKFSNKTISGNTISEWETKPNRAPDLYFFFNCFTTYTDWRMYFAVDALKALMPHVFDSGMVTFHLPKYQ
jgi:hypothetical protein